MDHITSSDCIAGAGLHACARAVRLRQVGVAPEEAGGGVAREAVVTVAAGGVGGGVKDIPALAARSATFAADEARP
jgi:N-acetylglutamate synthase-like GNAT family acetyltransferase